MPIRSWSNNLKIRLFGEALYNMLFWMYFPFLTVYFGEALGNHMAGILMSVPPVFSLLGSLLGGALADRLGRRPVMLIGAMTQTLMFASFAVSPSPWVDYLAFIGVGLGGAVYRPASSAMVADLVPPDKRREIFATFMTANNIGAVLGPALGAVFFFKYRQELLYTCASVLLLYFIAIYFMIRETMPQTRVKPESAGTVMPLFTEQWKGYGVILRDKVFLIYILAGIFALMPIMQLDLYMAVYVTRHVPAQAPFSWLGIPLMLSGKEIYGWLVGFNGLLFVLFILPVTKRFDGWRERNVFVLSAFLCGGGNFLLGLNVNMWYLLAATTILTFGEIVRTPVSQSFISRYAPEHARGQYMGADGLQNTISRFISPMTVFLASWVPVMGIFSIILAFALVGLALYIWLFRVYVEQLF